MVMSNVGYIKPLRLTCLQKESIRNPLATFRGNRFNTLFYDAGTLHYISDLVKAFFKDVWLTPNQLLRAVYQGFEDPEYVAVWKALGLVNRMITGPLSERLSHEIM